MTEAHENHLHLLVCIDRLNSAWRTLKMIETSPDHPLVGPAFRYALVEYATAFTRSDGRVKKSRKLSCSCVPSHYHELHQRIINARHKIHAHADLIALDATLHVSFIDGTKLVGSIQNYVHGLEELKNLRTIIGLVESVLENLYTQHQQSEKRLTP